MIKRVDFSLYTFLQKKFKNAMYSLHTYIKTRGGKCLSMFYALASLHKAYIILHKIYLFLAKSIHVLRILKAGERHAMLSEQQ